MTKNLVELMAKAVHEAYCECYEEREGKPYWTGGDYDKLDQSWKEVDRTIVRTVLSVVKERIGDVAEICETCAGTGEKYDKGYGRGVCNICKGSGVIARKEDDV
jgi:DnaJ-class molecular chaperone